MKCPRDGALLVPHSIRNVKMHACEECGGVFVGLDQEGVPALSFKALKPGERSRIPVAEEAKLISPASGNRMLVFQFRGVEIDYCPDSNSVWLDPGEWKKVTETATSSSKKGSWAFSQSRSDGNPILNGLDAAFSSIDIADFIGEAISSIFDAF